MDYVWVTQEHGEIPCQYRGLADDGYIFIRVPDPYDLGMCEIRVPRFEVRPAHEPEKKTSPAVWVTKS